MNFPTHLASIEARVQNIDVAKYAGTRNYRDGAVTYLSAYVSRGVISTRKIYEHVITLDLPAYKIEKFVQELAWRDYWQQIHMVKGDAILSDFKFAQKPVDNWEIPKSVVDATTGIDAVDDAIKQLYDIGYMHNHMRMYVAGIVCNVANSHWLQPAKWLYANLLDGDVASNHLSWQWVAGSFSNRNYVANQQNINRYFKTSQKETFLSLEYSEFKGMKMPDVLKETVLFEVETNLPKDKHTKLDNKKTLIYNYYNLDPYWHSSDDDFQRIFLLEPSFFKKYPVQNHCIDFVLGLSENIKGIKIFVGEFSELLETIEAENISYKEHPTNLNYAGTKEPRDWLCTIDKYYPSYFPFYKHCKKELQKD